MITIEDAERFARIISTADSGCSCCVGSLVEEANDAFPEFVFKMEKEEWHRPLWPDADEDERQSFPVVSVRKAQDASS